MFKNLKLLTIFYKFYKSTNQKKISDFLSSKNRCKGEGKNGIRVLIQCTEDMYYLSLFGLIIAEIRKNKNAHVEQYVVRSLTLGSTTSIRGVISKLFFSNRIIDNKWVKLHSSFCNGVAYRYKGKINFILSIKALYRAIALFSNIDSKESLLRLKYNEIMIGDLIYDSYLRFKPAPTVDINNKYLLIIIWQAIKNIKITNKYFVDSKPDLLLTSYSTYIQHGITVRLALHYGVQVQSFGNYEQFSKNLTIDDWFHTKNCESYKSLFDNYPKKEELAEKSKEKVEERLMGAIDNSTFYMKKSAYADQGEKIPNIKDLPVIFLHDFYDSPHIYKNMVFTDFLSWIEFTIKTLNDNKIRFYVKPHPNEVKESSDVVKYLQSKYSNLNVLSSKITNKQLVDAGMRIGVSVYGTIAHELTYLGVPVILCGSNPHSSYDFCFEAQSKNEYIALLRGYKKLKLVENYKNEVASFYYMHSGFDTEMYNLMSLLVFLMNYKYNDSNIQELEDYMGKIIRVSSNDIFRRNILKFFN
jgi:hypothetical protein